MGWLDAYKDVPDESKAPAKSWLSAYDDVPDEADPTAARPVTDDMSTYERTAAGLGQGVTSVGMGIKQNDAHQRDALQNGSILERIAAGLSAGPIGMARSGIEQGMEQWRGETPGSGAEADRRAVDADVNERAKLDKALLDTTAGRAGSIGGQILATAPIALVPGGTSALGKAGIAAATGAAANMLNPVETRSDTEALITGEPAKSYAEGKAEQGLWGAGGGAIASGALSGLGKAVEALASPRAAILSKVAGKAKDSPIVKEGAGLRERTGIDFTVGQETESGALKQLENASRQSFWSRDIANESDRGRVQQLSDYFDRTMDDLTKADSSPAATADAIRTTVKGTVARLEKMRRTAAEKDYGAVRAMTKDQAAIVPAESNAYLLKLVDEHANTGAEGSDKIARWAQHQLANVDESIAAKGNAMADQIGDYPIAGQLRGAAAQTAPSEGNLDKLLKLRRNLSKVAGGEAKISGENQDRMIAREMLQAIDNDIENAAETIGGDLGGALKTANANYRAYSGQIEGVKASPLGKLLGEEFTGDTMGAFNTLPPETVVDRMRALKPSQVASARLYLEKENPEALQVWRRAVVEDAIEKSKQMPASAGADTPVLRPDVLVKTLEGNNAARVLLPKGEAKAIADGITAARKLGDKTGYNFSGTAGQQEVLDVFNKPLGALKQGGEAVAGAVVKTGAMALGTRKIAEVMLNPKAREALFTIRRLPEGSSKARQAAAYLTSVFADDAMESSQGNDRTRKTGQNNQGH